MLMSRNNPTTPTHTCPTPCLVPHDSRGDILFRGFRILVKDISVFLFRRSDLDPLDFNNKHGMNDVTKMNSRRSSKTATAVTPATGLRPIRVRIVMVGAEKTGKSCLIKRYCEKRFVSKYMATIGIDYGATKIYVDKVRDHS